MITFSTRPLTDEEKNTIRKRLPSFYKLLEEYMLFFITIIMALLIPMLIVNHYFPLSSTIQLIYCICVGVLSIFIANYGRKKYGAGKIGKTEDILNMDYEVVHVKTSRAIKRKDPEDFDNVFPTTDFEFVREKGSEEFVDFKTLGQHFNEEKVLPAFGKEVWAAGAYPINGQLLDITIEEVV